jgi:hypothetical protein
MISTQTQQIPARRRKRAQTTGATLPGNPLVSGLAMMFDHDSEEEAELKQFQQPSSSSSEPEEDEEEVRTDLIKYKKKI